MGDERGQHINKQHWEACSYLGKKTQSIKYTVKTMNLFRLWHIVCLSVNTAQTKKPLSKGHKGLRLLTCKGTLRAHLNMRWLSTISQHSPVIHQNLVRFAPQVHFNSSYSGYTYQGGCGLSETTNQKSPSNYPSQLKMARKTRLLVLWFLGCCLRWRTFALTREQTATAIINWPQGFPL